MKETVFIICSILIVVFLCGFFLYKHVATNDSEKITPVTFDKQTDNDVYITDAEIKAETKTKEENNNDIDIILESDIYKKIDRSYLPWDSTVECEQQLDSLNLYENNDLYGRRRTFIMY